jgi:hypothetical protein
MLPSIPVRIVTLAALLQEMLNLITPRFGVSALRKRAELIVSSVPFDLKTVSLSNIAFANRSVCRWRTTLSPRAESSTPPTETLVKPPFGALTGSRQAEPTRSKIPARVIPTNCAAPNSSRVPR